MTKSVHFETARRHRGLRVPLARVLTALGSMRHGGNGRGGAAFPGACRRCPRLAEGPGKFGAKREEAVTVVSLVAEFRL